MKKVFFLCAVLGAGLLLGSCAQQNTADASRRGLVGPGSVAPVSTGPSHPGPLPRRFEP